MAKSQTEALWFLTKRQRNQYSQAKVVKLFIMAN